MVPRAAPPPTINALWARVEAPNAADLATALAHLEPVMPRARLPFVTVRYAAEALVPESTQAHAAFAARHPHASTALPFCLPGSANYARLGALATPPDCAGCLFYEGQACAGLGHEALPWAALAPETAALRGFEISAITAADFAGTQPVACWRPTHALIATLAAAVRAVGGRLLDVGGGNGFFSALLAAEGVKATVLDVADGPTPAGVSRVVGDANEAMHVTDAVLISWPPTGQGFRALADTLNPAVVIQAYDADHLCGRQPDHAGVVATAAGLRWFGWPRTDDLGPWPGLPHHRRWTVLSYRALCAGSALHDGVVEVWSAVPLVDHAPAGVYAWEALPES
jgi:hypothetical protein